MRNLLNDEFIPVPSDVRSFPGIEPAARIPLFYFPLSVRRGTAEILTIHNVKSCPYTKDEADQRPPTMFRIEATTSDGSIRTV
jgi:hypothetical protein